MLFLWFQYDYKALGPPLEDAWYSKKDAHDLTWKREDSILSYLGRTTSIICLGSNWRE